MCKWWWEGKYRDKIPRISIAFYYIKPALKLTFITFGCIIIANSEGEKAFFIPTREAIIFSAVTLLLMVSIYIIREKYFFSVTDLDKLVKAMGGTLVKKQYGRYRYGEEKRWTKARLNNLWLLVWFDDPIMEYGPWRHYISVFGASYPIETSNYNLDHQSEKTVNKESHLLGQASFFQLGDFSKLPEITVRLTKDVSDRLSSLKSSNPVLYYAIIDAVSVIKDPTLVPTLEVSEKWLRVAIRASRGLGKIFGDRIMQTMELTEKLVEGLSSHYTFYEVDEWTIDLNSSNEFEVSRLESSEQASTGQKTIMI